MKEFNRIILSSVRMDWETPQDFFDKYNSRFNFTLDVCCVPETAKCEKYFTPLIDGLKQDWSKDICWMNPPYGRQIGSWMKKAKGEQRLFALSRAEQIQGGGGTIA